MGTLRDNLAEFLHDDLGIATVEYAVVLCLIILVAIGAIAGIGVSMANSFAGLDDGVASTL
jgi:Flp pilus assembly pilin Flp